jgi:hypothetical protein
MIAPIKTDLESHHNCTAPNATASLGNTQDTHKHAS